jgi:hypothetical protein
MANKFKVWRNDWTITAKKKTAVKSVPKPSMEKVWLHHMLMQWGNENKLKLEPEYRFHPERKWRFDWAFPDIKLAVEYEGLFSSKSRHTTIGGFIGDVEKYNQATILGWRVIRVTARDYKYVTQLLNQLITEDAKECVRK